MKPDKNPIRNCDECLYYVFNEEKRRGHCKRGQLLHFVIPTADQVENLKAWGYRRRCKLFIPHEPATKEA